MCSVVRSSVKYNGQTTTEQVQSHLGVKQGDPSSALMFINDIMSNINTNLNDIFSIEDIKLFLILYADDQVLFATSPSSLEIMLKDIENYCNTYKLKIIQIKLK